jgi:hypothetical protein
VTRKRKENGGRMSSTPSKPTWIPITTIPRIRMFHCPLSEIPDPIHVACPFSLHYEPMDSLVLRHQVKLALPSFFLNETSGRSRQSMTLSLFICSILMKSFKLEAWWKLEKKPRKLLYTFYPEKRVQPKRGNFSAGTHPGTTELAP